MSSKIAIEILAYKNIDKKKWYLCKDNLMEYLSNLKDDFYEFAIQRRIVKNQYLDSLYNTIKSGDPITVLTLTYSQKKLPSESGKSKLDMSKIEILDGLLISKLLKLISPHETSPTPQIPNPPSPRQWNY